MLNTINPNMPSYPTTTDPNSTHKISTDDMILLVGMESMKACENKVQAYYSQVDQVTKLIKNITKAMEEAAKQLKNGGSLKDVKFQYVDADGKTREMDMKTFLEQCGVACPEPHLPKFLQDILQSSLGKVIGAIIKTVIPESVMKLITRAVEQAIKEVLKQVGIPIPNAFFSLDPEEWKVVFDNLKLHSDSLGGDNQKDMMKLQAAINDYNETTTKVSNNLSKLSQMNTSIIANMR